MRQPSLPLRISTVPRCGCFKKMHCRTPQDVWEAHPQAAGSAAVAREAAAPKCCQAARTAARIRPQSTAAVIARADVRVVAPARGYAQSAAAWRTAYKSS